MKLDALSVILIVGVVIFFIVVTQRCRVSCLCSSERFGQDASIRATSGWIAGPKNMYGYDPIDVFARQIAEMKARKRAEPRDSQDPRLVMMTDYPNLEDSPTKDIGPIAESYREGHPPYMRRCTQQSDCWEGEQCLRNTCLPEIPSDRETFEHPEKEKLCMSCMTTEEMESI